MGAFAQQYMIPYFDRTSQIDDSQRGGTDGAVFSDCAAYSAADELLFEEENDLRLLLISVCVSAPGNGDSLIYTGAMAPFELISRAPPVYYISS